ncbi:MAG: acetolactate synthase large subunit [Microthrixaceae bacterium]
MNGAQALIRTLVDAGVDTCFMNPGTSEMHFVAALDDVPDMHGVLALFEGVATGAADGYARMAGGPAASLLHLGPGLGNGLANLHNARRGNTPVVNIVGDHATYHARYDAPLQSDIAAIASALDGWVRSCSDPAQVAADAATAVAVAQEPPGQVATLILPADVSWSESTGPAAAVPVQVAGKVGEPVVAAVADALAGDGQVGIMVGGAACTSDALDLAGTLCARSGATLLAETFPARLERGAGRVEPQRLGYLAEFAEAQLAGLDHLVLVEAREPVSFFAYPDKASTLVPAGCEVHKLVAPGQDRIDALARVLERIGGDAEPTRQAAQRPELPTGSLDGETLARTIGALLPEGAIVCDEGNTTGLFVSGATAGAPPHDWLTLTGGSIGFGMPVATGAAVACPERKVLNLESDGSAMYTFQSLWTQVREGLDVTTVILNNSSYAVLEMELARVGASADGAKAREMLDLTGPDLDFVSMARGLGVDQATRAMSAEEFNEQLGAALAAEGPALVEAVVPPLM